MAASYKRTIEDVATVIGHAKLDVNELRPVSQLIYFGKKFEKYKLLELDADVLDSLKEGERVKFKGEANDKAVLCTNNQTYEVKEAETSNSLLLIPSMKFVDEIPAVKSERQLEVKEIVDIFHDYYEIKKIKPRLSRIRHLLNEKQYKGSELEEEHQSNGYYTTDDLIVRIQASEEEIKQGLLDIDAVCINGKWRLLEDQYQFRALSFMLNLLDENSWKVNEVPLGETLEILNELLPKEIASHIVEMYLEPTGEFNDEGDTLMQIKEEKTCRYLGGYLLRQAAKFSLKDFLEAWQQSVPEGLSTDLKQLAGLALYSLESKPQLIWYFPEEDLPTDLNERFSILFKQREKWTFSEIEPYVRKLASEKQSSNAILTKFSRVSHINNIKYYSSRHGK
ncbi:sister chromatid cohesion protein DCC1 [Rhodnius prolixus]|uniref:sister chromatid cohesion protein DCC1 n=1 Tax=Rhodnius prolixus TaxID=13249 RepID=UPI003D188917